MRDLFHLQTDPPASGDAPAAPIMPEAEPSATEGVDVSPPVNPDSIPGDEPTPTTPGPDVAPPPPPPAPPLSPDSPSDAAAGVAEPGASPQETDAAREARQDAELDALAAANADEPTQVAAQPTMPGEPSTGAGDAVLAEADAPAEIPVGPTGEVAPGDQAREAALDSLRETATVFAQKCEDAIQSGVSVMEVLGIASGAIQSVQR